MDYLIKPLDAGVLVAIARHALEVGQLSRKKSPSVNGVWKPAAARRPGESS